LLESGKNVVTSAFLFYPPYMPAGDLRRIEAACERGRTSVHGTGINPGFVGDLLVLVLSSLCRRIEHVHVTERGDWSLIDSPKMIFDLARFGHDPKEVVMENHPYARFMSGLFLESVGLVAAGIGTRLDDKRTIQELEVSDKDFQVAGRPVRAGTVSGQRYRWQGLLNDKAVIEIETLWTIGDQYPAHWPKARAGWTVTIEGEPSLQVTFISLATLDWAKKVPFSEHINSTLVATAAHAVNSVIPVCEAEPGVRTFPDLPLITGAHAGP
jgi:hypothetical protein